MTRWNTREILLNLGLVLFLTTSVCSGTGWQITQLTDNSYDDQTPSILGNRVAWSAARTDSWEIMYYDGSQTTRITSNTYGDILPSLSEEGICWQSQSGGTDWEILYRSGSDTTQLTNNITNDLFPKACNGMAVWSSGSGTNSEIYLYDGSVVTPLTADRFADAYPTISSAGVAWHSLRDKDWEIILRDSSGNVKQLTDNDVDDTCPYFCQNLLVWKTDKPTANDGHLGQIAMYDGLTTTLITDDDVRDNSEPVTDGLRVAWRSRDIHAENHDIFLYTGTDILRLTDGSYDADIPVISEFLVVWNAFDGHDDEIFVYDGVSVLQLTDNDYDDILPCVSGRNIAWVGCGGTGSGTDGEIFLATHMPEPCTAMLLLFGIGWLTKPARARTIRRSYDNTYRSHG